MKPWYRYYVLLQAVFSYHRLRVALEDVLNDELTLAINAIRNTEHFQPTTLEFHEFMLHVCANPVKFLEHELLHLMRMEPWDR